MNGSAGKNVLVSEEGYGSLWMFRKKASVHLRSEVGIVVVRYSE